MKRTIILSIALMLASGLQAQNTENVKFGNFEQWTVRMFKESGVLGGKTVPLYVVGPRDTIVGNKAYDYSKTIWASSNSFAQVMGITKISCSVMPDKGPSGTCARLETNMVKCKAIGIIDINVLAQGALFWGKVWEPITSTKTAEAAMEWGIPFTRKPAALIFDYKATLPNTGRLLKDNKEIDGYDPEEAMFILQKRWEDKDGNLHAKRVGTAIHLIEKSTGSWVKGMRVPVIYGDATKDPAYNKAMALMDASNKIRIYARNSRGESRQVIEEGWASPDETPTHALLNFTSGTQGAFCGALGNILWVDNVKLEY